MSPHSALFARNTDATRALCGDTCSIAGAATATAAVTDGERSTKTFSTKLDETAGRHPHIVQGRLHHQQPRVYAGPGTRTTTRAAKCCANSKGMHDGRPHGQNLAQEARDERAFFRRYQRDRGEAAQGSLPDLSEKPSPTRGNPGLRECARILVGRVGSTPARRGGGAPSASKRERFLQHTWGTMHRHAQGGVRLPRAGQPGPASNVADSGGVRRHSPSMARMIAVEEA